jgi:hypothetical protein
LKRKKFNPKTHQNRQRHKAPSGAFLLPALVS